MALLVAAAQAQSPFYLKSGDTVVFYGDSITDQRLYTTFVETYVVTRYPKMPVTFIHSGWGGDRVSGGGGGPIQTRLTRDVLAYKPTVMTIMLGMNDGRYRAFDDGLFQEFSNGYANIVKTVKAAVPGIRITAIQPSPYDDVTRPALFEGGYNAVLARYGAYLKDLGEKEKLTVADMNSPVVDDLKAANALDAVGAAKLIPDRVHPGAAGHLLMAKALLKAWGATPVVSTVVMDAAGKVERSENTTISRQNGLSWTQLDAALPMPLDTKDAGVALAVKASDVEQSLNRQMLQVTGLTGTYTLTIDGEPVGTFSATQLESGINLAMLPTPMAKQATSVHALTLQHTGIHQTRWRQIQVPLVATPTTAEAIAVLDKLDAELIAKQRAAAQPVEHRYELKPSV